MIGRGQAGNLSALGFAGVMTILNGYFDCLLNGARPVGCEQDMSVRGWQQVGEAMGKPDRLGMGQIAKNAVLELSGLALDCPDDGRVTVAEGATPPG